jgi:hypothetical protein
VGDKRLLFRSDDEWPAFAEGLKQTSCPHCKVAGSLNKHGFLYGFDETSPRRVTVRARRVFCSNRNARPGCGRTFSIWFADKIGRLSLTTGGLWRFLQAAVAVSIVAARRAFFGSWLDVRTWQRIWKRFDQGQSKIRTALYQRCPPPQSPPQPPVKPGRQPAAQVLEHLKAAFPDAYCPITAFQLATRTFFM